MEINRTHQTIAHRRNHVVTINNRDSIVKLQARLIDEEMEQLWNTGEWNQQKLDALKTAHFRTAYR